MQLQKELAMKEMKVGIRELKRHLSEYLRRVRAGQIINIIEHEKVIGQIVPVKQSLEEHMKVTVMAGIVEWNGQKLKVYKPIAINKGARQLSDLIVEDRAR